MFVALHTADSELTMVVGLFLTLPVLFLTSALFPRRYRVARPRRAARRGPGHGRQASSTIADANTWGDACSTEAASARVVATSR